MQPFRSPDIGMFGRRQRHARGHRIPVTIVTDFETPRDREKVSVADGFGADDIAPLGNGCECCTVRVELQAALRRLLAEREHGKHFTRVIIETREDLAPILRTFVSERALGADFYVEQDPGIHADGVSSFTLTEDSLSWEAFSRFITTLQALRGTDLLHVKGLLNVAGCRGPVVVQFMQHLAHSPVELQAWPNDDRTSRIAFVTRNVEEAAVRHLFSAVRTLSTSC